MGPVRDTQEDYLITFQVGDLFVGILADGAGGHPGGEQASYWGTVGAACSVIRNLTFGSSERQPNLEKVARQAVLDASFAISIQAASLGVPMRSSMRSTLIVVIATADQFAWAHLGDGGGWTIRATPRRFEPFLTPAKGKLPHLLTSSLGPYIAGDISSGSRDWGDADFLVIASDGVADVIATDVFFNALSALRCRVEEISPTRLTQCCNAWQNLRVCRTTYPLD